ncbi:unnamed protein product [Moneuplotes crassus]|uniref:Cytochrome b5 heme-binding domain-containing protein n=1 Tax=Euplotes crassus TaxID=5936 RepID=A0AAD1Y471_EUPCR|nr:unnamed protein product [Moneuplotes crassus]
MEREYTWEEVAKHNKDDDLWIVIQEIDEDEKPGRFGIYDVTNYNDHPGGRKPHLANAGKNATKHFYYISHSPQAHADMKRFLVGYLKDGEKETYALCCKDTPIWKKVVCKISILALTGLISLGIYHLAFKKKEGSE